MEQQQASQDPRDAEIARLVRQVGMLKSELATVRMHGEQNYEREIRREIYAQERMILDRGDLLQRVEKAVRYIMDGLTKA